MEFEKIKAEKKEERRPVLTHRAKKQDYSYKELKDLSEKSEKKEKDLQKAIALRQGLLLETQSQVGVLEDERLVDVYTGQDTAALGTKAWKPKSKEKKERNQQIDRAKRIHGEATAYTVGIHNQVEEVEQEYEDFFQPELSEEDITLEKENTKETNSKKIEEDISLLLNYDYDIRMLSSENMIKNFGIYYKLAKISQLVIENEEYKKASDGLSALNQLKFLRATSVIGRLRENLEQVGAQNKVKLPISKPGDKNLPTGKEDRSALVKESATVFNHYRHLKSEYLKTMITAENQKVQKGLNKDVLYENHPELEWVKQDSAMQFHDIKYAIQVHEVKQIIDNIRVEKVDFPQELLTRLITITNQQAACELSLEHVKKEALKNQDENLFQTYEAPLQAMLEGTVREIAMIKKSAEYFAAGKQKELEVDCSTYLFVTFGMVIEQESFSNDVKKKYEEDIKKVVKYETGEDLLPFQREDFLLEVEELDVNMFDMASKEALIELFPDLLELAARMETMLLIYHKAKEKKEETIPITKTWERILENQEEFAYKLQKTKAYAEIARAHMVHKLSGNRLFLGQDYVGKVTKKGNAPNQFAFLEEKLQTLKAIEEKRLKSDAFQKQMKDKISKLQTKDKKPKSSPVTQEEKQKKYENLCRKYGTYFERITFEELINRFGEIEKDFPPGMETPEEAEGNVRAMMEYYHQIGLELHSLRDDLAGLDTLSIQKRMEQFRNHVTGGGLFEAKIALLKAGLLPDIPEIIQFKIRESTVEEDIIVKSREAENTLPVALLTREQAIHSKSDETTAESKKRLFIKCDMDLHLSGAPKDFQEKVKEIKKYAEATRYEQGYTKERQLLQKAMQKVDSYLKTHGEDTEIRFRRAMEGYQEYFAQMTNGTLQIPEGHVRRVKANPSNARAGVIATWTDVRKRPLFAHEPNVNDIKQRTISNCYMLAGLSSLVEQEPGKIKECLKDNGDGTVTVRFYKREKQSKEPRLQALVEEDYCEGNTEKEVEKRIAKFIFTIAKNEMQWVDDAFDGAGAEDEIEELSLFGQLSQAHDYEAVLSLAGKLKEEPLFSSILSFLNKEGEVDEKAACKAYQKLLKESCENQEANAIKAMKEILRDQVQAATHNEETAKDIYVTVSKEIPQIFGNINPYSSGSLWVQMIEKAFAVSGLTKEGGYDGIQYGEGSDFLQHIVGTKSSGNLLTEKIALEVKKPFSGEYGEDAVALYHRIEQGAANHEVFNAGTKGKESFSTMLTSELHQGHAYGVLGTHEEKDVKYVILRNPYSETALRYKEEKDGSITKEKDQFTLGRSSGETYGQFYMELNDFIQQFAKVTAISTGH